MQSYKEDELLRTEAGEPGELVKTMPAQATHHIIGRIPSKGSEVTINGLVWIVEYVKFKRGWMRLRLKNTDELATAQAD